MSFKCQCCKRPILNRSRNQCELCGATIAESQRLTPQQQKTLQSARPAPPPGRAVYSPGASSNAVDYLSFGVDVIGAAASWFD